MAHSSRFRRWTRRLAKVLVPEAEYDRAHRLFYAEREDEL